MVSTRRDDVLKATVKRRAPRLTAWVQNRRAVTVQDGWEGYARARKPDPDVHLGDEWSNPSEMGLDCEASEVVEFIDRLASGEGGARPDGRLLRPEQEVVAARRALGIG